MCEDICRWLHLFCMFNCMKIVTRGGYANNVVAVEVSGVPKYLGFSRRAGPPHSCALGRFRTISLMRLFCYQTRTFSSGSRYPCMSKLPESTRSDPLYKMQRNSARAPSHVDAHRVWSTAAPKSRVILDLCVFEPAPQFTTGLTL